MTPERKLKLIRDMVIENLIFYDSQVSDIKVKMFAQELEPYDLAAIDLAFRKFRMEKGRRMMPMPSDVVASISPQADPKDLGRETALRIRAAVSKYGWPQPEAAQAYIGQTGWDVVQRFGGWQHLCENLGVTIQETTFLAQCRDAVESVVRLGEAGFDLSMPSIEQKSQVHGNLTSAREVVQKILGKEEHGNDQNSEKKL